ncbi:MAG: fumarylacetoacetate hydrolase family protein [Desulfobacterales bacterium]|nr:fumarylacetoacetate hydrolase family protein [Desulfobacterales bacterium]
MRLVMFGEKGRERPGLLRGDKVVDLKKIFPEIPDIGEAFFEEGWLAKIESIDLPGDHLDARLASPVIRPSKIICLGKNYAEHAREGGFEKPASPLIFCKTPNTVSGPFDDILTPQSSGQVDWEVELALVIGRRGKAIEKAAAWEHIAGYMVMNDVSGREAQFQDSQWFRGKAFDTFAPMGPALVTPDEIEKLEALTLGARVNGEVMQSGNTRDMIFDIPTIIANVSQDITLVPGDVISTGTPSGVGIFRDPPITLKPGDVVECSISEIGTIRNRVV